MTEKIYVTPAELIKRWAGAVSRIQTLVNWRNAGRGPEYGRSSEKFCIRSKLLRNTSKPTCTVL